MHYLTIVRHGQTPANVNDIVQSRTGGNLTELGKKMARSLGKHIKEENFTRIYSSDLHRCRETIANIISQMEVETPPVEFTSILRERDYGDYEFLSGKVAHNIARGLNLPPQKWHHIPIPNGESYEECLERTEKFFSQICKVIDDSDENTEENILAVSHGIFIITLFEFLMKNRHNYEFTNEMKEARPRLENTCRTRIAIGKLQPGDKENQNKRHITITHLFNADHLPEDQKQFK